jgi:hypothetical protein
MSTPRKSAPFDIQATRGRSQPSRNPVVDVEVVHRIAKLELELLDIVHDHYGLDLPAVTSMSITTQRDWKTDDFGPVVELGSLPEGSGQSVRKLFSRLEAVPTSSGFTEVAGHCNRQVLTFTITCRFISK